MRLLLDTHALIWWVEGSGRLGKQAHHQIRSAGALISAVSIWEIAIKSARRRLRLRRPPEEWLPELLEIGFDPLFITLEHAEAIGSLPLHHSDPFDRMLIAQARCEALTVVTADAAFDRYGIPILRATE